VPSDETCTKRSFMMIEHPCKMFSLTLTARKKYVDFPEKKTPLPTVYFPLTFIFTFEGGRPIQWYYDAAI
jgi:hypothetical protein